MPAADPPSRPDPALVFGSLSEIERSVVRDWLRELRIDPESWPAVPAIRAVLETVAVNRLAGDRSGSSRADAIRAAAEALGLEDDDEAATHPADRYRRLIDDWRRAAGRFFHAPEDEAA